MSLNLEQKQAVVAEVAKQVSGAQAIVMVENRGMAVADMTRLRAKARASGVYFRVVKNTLVRRAVAETPNFCSITLMSSESSRTVIDAILSRISACATAMICS